jgi:hypothetical protein
VPSAEPLVLEVSDFVRSIIDGGTPRSSAALGSDVVAVIEAAARSARLGGSAETLDAAEGAEAAA